MDIWAPFLEESLVASGGRVWVGDGLAGFLGCTCPIAEAADNSRYHAMQGRLD